MDHAKTPAILTSTIVAAATILILRDIMNHHFTYPRSAYLTLKLVVLHYAVSL
jgi:hypothetical protein